MKKLVSKRLLAKKAGKLYEVRKEELTFDDGSKEVRVGCYTSDGKYLGDHVAARAYFENLNKPKPQPKKQEYTFPSRRITRG